MSNSVSVQQAIRFLYLQIIKVEFLNKNCGNLEFPDDLKLNFTFATTSITDHKTETIIANKFCVSFKIAFFDPDEIFSLSIEADALFESTSPINKEFLESDFSKLNAPAIAFPFLRSFISNFTLNAGYNPIILPAFNFSEVVEVSQD